MKKMMGIVCLLAVAIIFGTAFSFQSIAAQLLGPFYLNAARLTLGGLVLVPFLFRKDGFLKKDLLTASFLDGMILFLAPNIQQIAIKDTPVGKTGFITALYIVLVPLLSFLFYRKRPGKKALISLMIALIGLYLLCGLTASDLSLRPHDLYLIITAVFFALQILVIERYADKVDPFKFCCLAFLFSGLLSFVCALFESYDAAMMQKALPSILYLGIVSTGIGYTLQPIGQRIVPSMEASLLMSLESVFSALAGYLILHQTLSSREILGCILMFAAVILCQIPEKKKE